MIEHDLFLEARFLGAINPGYYRDAMVWLPGDWGCMMDKALDRADARANMFRYLTIASQSAKGRKDHWLNRESVG